MLSEVKKNPRVSAKDLQKSLAHANISVDEFYDTAWTDHRRKNEFPSLSRHFAAELKAICPPIEATNRRWVMQQDNDSKHRSKSTTEWLQQKKIRLLEWPSQSPDLNPIEMLWHDLKRAIHTRHRKNIAELKQFCKEELSKISPDHCAGNSWSMATGSLPFV
ncbi:hypothetical protein L3Q82_000380 [Scortum barcoo]|uniref:Uncharacterized protein n=1 Tax=Scortum barcoo TaxID=214431 RepID=A0ACB8X901_9TELE|nr:hypothetical protein L3Q82_000380 [Scortum barcoo]